VRERKRAQSAECKLSTKSRVAAAAAAQQPKWRNTDAKDGTLSGKLRCTHTQPWALSLSLSHTLCRAAKCSAGDKSEQRKLLLRLFCRANDVASCCEILMRRAGSGVKILMDPVNEETRGLFLWGFRKAFDAD
jgi:hypothetical protein